MIGRGEGVLGGVWAGRGEGVCVGRSVDRAVGKCVECAGRKRGQGVEGCVGGRL